jgi:hypothetical protein
MLVTFSKHIDNNSLSFEADGKKLILLARAESQHVLDMLAERKMGFAGSTRIMKIYYFRFYTLFDHHIHLLLIQIYYSTFPTVAVRIRPGIR